MENWKKLVIRAAALGAGFAITAALLVALAFWWSKRPVKPRPWDQNAITASFETLTTEGDTNTIVIVYTLQNNTDYDYRVGDKSDMHVGASLKQSKSFSFDGGDDFLKADYPIYVPSKGRVRYRLHLSMPYRIKDDFDASNDVRHDWETTLCQFVDQRISNVGGFVLLDDNSRYQVNLPNGWTARGKEPLRTKPAASAN